MSWGSAGTGIASAFKKGMDNKPSAQQMMQANYPGGGAPQGYQPPAPPAQAQPPAAPITVGQNQAPPPMTGTPLLQLIHAIWGQKPQAAPGGPAPKGYVSTTPAQAPEGDGY